jgi:hypothetical protein
MGTAAPGLVDRKCELIVGTRFTETRARPRVLRGRGGRGDFVCAPTIAPGIEPVEHQRTEVSEISMKIFGYEKLRVVGVN